MESMIRDINLAESGRKKIEWVKGHMPLLNYFNEKYAPTQLFKGINMVVTIHLEAKTAYLALTLKNCGANVTVTGSNPLSTQDDVAAALVANGVNVFATHGCTAEEYDMYLDKALDCRPQLIVDDGGDLVNMLHTTRQELIPNLWGGSEETTTGVHRLRALAESGKLAFPMIAVNDSNCKYLFDNRYGTGQSVWDGIMRTSNLIVAGKTVVVAGYGWCGKGVAMRAKGMGARVIVTEVDPIKGIEAVFDGFETLPMAEAAKKGDIFVTVTGCKDVIRKEHMEVMKDGVLLANAGHFDVEISKPDLEALTVKEPFEARNNITAYTLANGHQLNLLGEGRLVNLACGDGHPAEVMDLSFAMQFLAMRYVLENKGKLENKLYLLPEELDQEVASIKLKAMGFDVDTLSEEQWKYLHQA
ncbi:MAG: adenosylhomocysteinase [Acidaminococcaceae bacterium]|nr:adenosylhomocysteinase [Acidaminococcaceae bacterium]MBQ9697767.1 adenosylhomocysteinase [Acidaminococcaceae bacterium]